LFARQDITLISNPVCTNPVDLQPNDFQYYDKDGFELNQAEQKFYAAMNYPIDIPILNHCCWQQPWFYLERDDLGLILDHAMFLCRCNYSGQAQRQLEKLKPTVPTADYLLRTRVKWGFDFALDAVAPCGTVFEVLHVEFDSNDYDYFNTRMFNVEYAIRHNDWQDAADRVWKERTQWQDLKSFAQNDWKAEYLLGWKKGEYTEKAI
jgi:hypothetical protein